MEEKKTELFYWPDNEVWNLMGTLFLVKTAKKKKIIDWSENQHFLYNMPRASFSMQEAAHEPSINIFIKIFIMKES